MRNLFVFLSIIFISCSSNTEDSTSINSLSIDPLIGKWRLQKEVFSNTITNVSFTKNASDCETMSYFLYHNNNTFNVVSYELNSNNNNCDLVPSTLEYANWQNIGSNTYKFISKYANENEEIGLENISFENNNSIYVITSTGNFLINGQLYDKQKEYYLKIN